MIIYLCKWFYKFFNFLYRALLKDGICGLMIIFIEEDLVQESIESVIHLFDKLVIVADKNLDTYSNLEKYMNNNKIKIIPIKKMKKHYSFYTNLAYKKCRYKYFCKVDADQIYIKENMNNSINYCMQNKNTIVYLSGVNVYNNHGKIGFLKNTEMIKNNEFNIRFFNGGVDHWIVPKALFSKFDLFNFDDRQLEVYKIFNISMLEKYYTALNWLHYGPVKIGLNIKSDLTTDLKGLYSFCQDLIINKNSQDFWLNKGLDNQKLDIFYQILKDNHLILNQYVSMYNDEHIKNTKHQWANKNLKNR